MPSLAERISSVESSDPIYMLSRIREHIAGDKKWPKAVRVQTVMITLLLSQIIYMECWDTTGQVDGQGNRIVH